MHHVHIEATSRDCDGKMYRDQVWTPAPGTILGQAASDPELLLLAYLGGLAKWKQGDGHFEVKEGSSAWDATGPRCACDPDRAIFNHTLDPLGGGWLCDGWQDWEHDGFHGWEVEMSWPTEEGFHAEHHRLCSDPDCDTGAKSQRDFTAEAMGY